MHVQFDCTCCCDDFPCLIGLCIACFELLVAPFKVFNLSLLTAAAERKTTPRCDLPQSIGEWPEGKWSRPTGFSAHIKAIEGDHAAVKTEFLKVMIEYKADALREIERRRKLGIKDVSDINPHPDDILIDMATSEVYVKGELNPKDSQMLRKLGLKR